MSRELDIKAKVLAVIRSAYQGETQEWIEEQTGIHQPQISALFSGRRFMSFGDMIKLCDAKGLDYAKVWEAAEIDPLCLAVSQAQERG